VRVGAALAALVVVSLVGQSSASEVVPVTDSVTQTHPDGWVLLPGGTGDAMGMVVGTAKTLRESNPRFPDQQVMNVGTGYGSLRLFDDASSSEYPEAVDTRLAGTPLEDVESITVTYHDPATSSTVALDVALAGGEVEQLHADLVRSGQYWWQRTIDATTTWLDGHGDPTTLASFASGHDGATIAASSDGDTRGLRLSSPAAELVLDRVVTTTATRTYTANFEPDLDVHDVRSLADPAVQSSDVAITTSDDGNGAAVGTGAGASVGPSAYAGVVPTALVTLRFRAYGDDRRGSCDVPRVRLGLSDARVVVYDPCLQLGIRPDDGVGWHEFDAMAGDWYLAPYDPDATELTDLRYLADGANLASVDGFPPVAIVPHDGAEGFVVDRLATTLTGDTEPVVLDFRAEPVVVAPSVTVPPLVSAPIQPAPSGGGTVTLQLPTGSVTITLDGGGPSGQAQVQQLPDATSVADTGGATPLVAWEVSVSDSSFRTAEICFDIPASTLAGVGAERPFRLLHKRADGAVEDVTTSIVGDRICGTTTSFSPFVLAMLPVERRAGTDAVSTAVAASAATFSPGVPVAYLASSTGWADALAAGAASKGAGPVLLVGPGGLDDATRLELQRLRPAEVVVLGGRAAVPPIEATVASLVPGPVVRLAGIDRQATAAAVSAASFSPGVPVAYVATGAGFADALGAGAAAVRDGGPVLLTSSGALSSSTAAELARLRPGRIVVVGGTGAVGAAVVKQLGGLTTGTVTRLAGADRYGTAAAVAATFPTASTVVAATGVAAGDALAGVPVAAVAKGPVLLVTADGVPGSTAAQVARLAPSRLVVLGGTSAVPDAVVRGLVTSLVN
jgi:putative cell wall-binding protein